MSTPTPPSRGPCRVQGDRPLPRPRPWAPVFAIVAASLAASCGGPDWTPRREDGFPGGKLLAPAWIQKIVGEKPLAGELLWLPPVRGKSRMGLFWRHRASAPDDEDLARFAGTALASLAEGGGRRASAVDAGRVEVDGHRGRLLRMRAGATGGPEILACGWYCEPTRRLFLLHLTSDTLDAARLGDIARAVASSTRCHLADAGAETFEGKTFRLKLAGGWRERLVEACSYAIQDLRTGREFILRWRPHAGTAPTEGQLRSAAASLAASFRFLEPAVQLEKVGAGPSGHPAWRAVVREGGAGHNLRGIERLQWTCSQTGKDYDAVFVGPVALVDDGKAPWTDPAWVRCH